MTEAGWLACSDPAWLLEPTNHIFHTRKSGLWAAACCRRIWHLLSDIHREVVIAVEASCERSDYLVGVVDDELKKRVIPSWAWNPGRGSSSAAAAVWSLAVGSHKSAAAEVAAALARNEIGFIPSQDQRDLRARYLAVWHREQAVHADLLRDVAGNPYRPMTFNPSWRTSTVLALARGIHDSCDFAALPILADALQDADCDNEVMLDHCRVPGPHVRGCWVVDLVLCKS